MTPVDFHRLAIDEARHEHRHYARVSAALAARFQADFVDTLGRISANPQIGPPHLHGTRVCRFRRFPFYFVYVEDPTELLVLAVSHNNRRPGYWRRRLP